LDIKPPSTRAIAARRLGYTPAVLQPPPTPPSRARGSASFAPRISVEAAAWPLPPAGPAIRYAGAVLVVLACTVVAVPMYRYFELANLTMVYLLGVVITAVAFGRWPAVIASLLSVAAFDFGFVPPRFTFRVGDVQYLVTLAVMLVVAGVTGTLTARLREQLGSARRRERRTAALYGLSRELASCVSTNELQAMAVDRISAVLPARVALLQPREPAGLATVAGDAAVLGGPAEFEAARRAFETGQAIGFDLRGGGWDVVHVPLEAGVQCHGVLSARPVTAAWEPERLQLLRLLAIQTSVALERCRLVDEAHTARAQAETERTRSALLSAVSHDLRTPLAAITGAATSLQDEGGRLSDATRRELAETIADEAQRLNRLITNVFEMTRLESGAIRVRRDWHSVEEIIGAALVRLEPLLAGRAVTAVLEHDLPLVSLDDVLFEQVVWNLVENALKYSPADGPVEVHARLADGALEVRVADHGPGLPSGDAERIFEKFYRGANASSLPGAGLGLAICQSIVAAHGGTITAANAPEGGAVFTVRLPLTGEPPPVEREPDDEAAMARPRD
jgi:two-component system sensor histidine kinase KdpD